MGAISNISANSNPQTQAVPLVPNPSASSSGLSFKDVFDAINPLQHIPVVSGMYRAVTGDNISAGAKLAGDVLYSLALGGGTLAVASSIGTSVADTAVQEVSGSSISSHILHSASSIAGNNVNAPTPLVPSANPAAVLASMESTTQQQPASVPELFTRDKNPAATAAQYQHAQILNSVDKKLVQIAS